jgi:hypothetical protein
MYYRDNLANRRGQLNFCITKWCVCNSKPLLFHQRKLNWAVYVSLNRMNPLPSSYFFIAISNMEKKMDEKTKEYLLSIMKSFEKGLVGILAIEIEGTIIRVPVPKLAALMAMEIVVDAESRICRSDDNPRYAPSPEKSRALSDLVRNYIRNLSDDEFRDFTSDVNINKVIQLANEKLLSMSRCECAKCGTCKEHKEDDEDGENEPNPFVN